MGSSMARRIRGGTPPTTSSWWGISVGFTDGDGDGGGSIDRSLTLSCAATLFCTAVPAHHAAISRRSGSGLSSSWTSGIHSPRGCMLFALSMFSTISSKLSKAVSLSSREMVGDWMAAMEVFMRSASEGPPIKDLRASALRGRSEGFVVAGESFRDASVFSMLHLRS